jgi:hypothetical protein
LFEHTISEDTPGAIVEMGFLSNRADRAFMLANRDQVARSVALGISRFLGERPFEGWPTPPLLPRGDIVEVTRASAPLYNGPGREFRLVDRASKLQRFAVAERRDGWAKLFAYTGEERWIADAQIRQVFVPGGPPPPPPPPPVDQPPPPPPPIDQPPPPVDQPPPPIDQPPPLPGLPPNLPLPPGLSTLTWDP